MSIFASGLLVGCGDNKTALPLTDSQSSVEERISPTDENNLSSSNAETVSSISENSVDVDLTVLSSTMVYSEVYNVLTNPDTYRGQTVKMSGLFTSYHDDITDDDYFACLIPDATACCSQGIEFQTTDDYSYPDDFPKDGTEITIIGIFDTCKKGMFEYAVLRDTTFAES